MTIRTNRFPDYAPLASSEVDLEAPQDAKASDPKEESYRNHLARAIQVFMVGLLLILATSLTVKWTAQRVILSENRCDNIAIRKEWRNLNDGEKTAYLRAVQCLRTIPSRLGHNQTLFDDFAYFHTRTGAEGVYEDEALSFTKVLMSVNSTLYGRFLELASMVPAHVRERYARAVCVHRLPYVSSIALEIFLRFVSQSVSDSLTLVIGIGLLTGMIFPRLQCGMTSLVSVAVETRAPISGSEGTASLTVRSRTSSSCLLDRWRSPTVSLVSS